MARAILILALLLTSGCVSNNDNPNAPNDLAASASPRRYDGDPDKPKRVCESTTIGTEAKTICY